jgi:hypothetical protein
MLVYVAPDDQRIHRRLDFGFAVSEGKTAGMAPKNSVNQRPSGQSAGLPEDTEMAKEMQSTLTSDEQRAADEIDFRFGPDPQPKRTADDGVTPRDPRTEAEAARKRNEFEIDRLRAETPARVRVDSREGHVRIEPADRTPSGYRQLMDVLGHADIDFVEGLLRSLGTASRSSKGIDDNSVDFLLSFIKSLKPRDQIEALLAAQMAAVHQAAMDEFQRLNRAESWQGHDSSLRAVTQLTRTFTAQMAGLKHYRTGGEQKVTVQHVSVKDGGQAIVAQVAHASASAADSVSETGALPPPSLREPPIEILADRPCEPILAAKVKRS